MSRNTFFSLQNGGNAKKVVFDPQNSIFKKKLNIEIMFLWALRDSLGPGTYSETDLKSLGMTWIDLEQSQKNHFPRNFEPQK